jgi:hypothetical protein
LVVPSSLIFNSPMFIAFNTEPGAIAFGLSRVNIFDSF